MSLNGRLTRLETQVRWLRDWGELRRLERRCRVHRAIEKVKRRNPEWAREMGWLPSLPPPPPRPPPPKPIPPYEPAPPVAEAPLAAPATPPSPPQPEKPAPEEPAPLVHAYDPPEHMQIRPVRWRTRGPQDSDGWHGHDPPGTNGQALVDYDPLAEWDEDPGDG